MATADEILATMSAEEEKAYLVIESDLRTITIPDEIKILGVESDDDVLRLHFKMPKMYGEFDLSEFELRVNYMNAGNEPDLYEVKDAAVSGDVIEFSWLVGRTAAKFKGDVKFIVCAKLIKADGVVEKEFNTTTAKLPVLEGLETSEAVVQLHPDIIEAILLRLSKLETSGGVTDEQIANALSEYLAENPMQPGATQEQAEQIQANKEAIEELQKNGTGGGITAETDPTVPAWAKAEEKPTYTAAEVGADPSGTADQAINTHDVDDEAHEDIRALIEGLTNRLNALADSDDTTLDQLSEIVAYIKNNKTLIDGITTGKISTSDIVNNLTTNVSTKVLSAAQGVALKALIDAIVIPTTLPNPQPIVINGVSYDGSAKKEITIQPGSSTGGAAIDDTTPSTGTTYSSSKIDALLNEQKEANEQQDERLTTLEHAGGIVTIEPAQDDVPIVFFGGDLPQSKTDTVMPFKYVSKTKTVSGYVETKAQGNSSMSYPKKNQTVKMYADEALEDSVKVDFKGWGAQKKHVYKANWIDMTHARNIVSAQLWGDVVKSRANYLDLPELLRTSPNQGAVDGFPALVYANGVYQGRYTINIPKDAWMANMDDSLDEHCILCGEGYVSGCFREASMSQWTDEVHNSVPSVISTRWLEIINFVMNSTDDEFKANLGNYFYVDSLIDYYLFGLASCGLDAFGKNQLYMTYDGQKWIASMYDMDSTWGLYWNGGSFVAADYERTSYEDYVANREGNLLYIRLERLFYEAIQARWAELKVGALSYPNIMTHFERFIDIVPPHIVKEDYASTTGGGKFTGIPSQSTNNIQQIRSFALARQAWTDEYVAALPPAEEIPCTGVALDRSALTFTGEGTQTLVATVTPSNTTDTVTWSSNAASVATVNAGAVTAVGNGDATITVTCGGYSATCAVKVSGIVNPEDEPIDYEKNPLESVTWKHGYSYNGGNGGDKVSNGDHRTDKFTLYSCQYNFSAGAGNTWPTIYIWNADGAYVGYMQDNITFWAKAGYQYALSIYRTTDNDLSGVTLRPVNNEDSAIETTIDLRELDWTVSGMGYCEAVVTNDLIGTTGIAGRVQKSNYLLKDGTHPVNTASTFVEQIFSMGVYAGKMLIQTKAFGKDLDRLNEWLETAEPLVFSK